MIVALFVFAAILGMGTFVFAVFMALGGKKPKPAPTPLDLALEVVETSLLTEPQTWKWTKHHAIKGDISIWIANDCYGLAVAKGDELAGPRNGGGNNLKLPSGWFARIWRAVKPELERKLREQDDALAASLTDTFRERATR